MVYLNYLNQVSVVKRVLCLAVAYVIPPSEIFSEVEQFLLTQPLIANNIWSNFLRFELSSVLPN